MNGINCFLEGFRLVLQPGLRQYVLIPLLINILVLGGIMAYGYGQYDGLMQYITGWLPDWLAFMSGIITFLAAVIIFAIGIYAFSIVGNIIAAPFNAILSEKVEDRLVPGSTRPQPNLAVLAVRSIGREFSKLLYLLPRLAGLLVLSVIPGVNALAPFAWLLFGAWMMALQYSDYAADNNQVSFAALRKRLGGNTFQALLFGMFVYLILAIPLVNLLLIPVAVAGGTVFWVEHLRQKSAGIADSAGSIGVV